MKFAFLLATCLVTSALAEAPVLQARMSSIFLTACWRAQNIYEIDIEGKLEIENTSPETILVAKKIDMVRTVTAALSAEEANRGIYSFAMNQEFGGTLDKEPRFEDFIAIKPGEKGTVELGVVVPANTDANYSGKDRLRLGKNWVQFSFFPIPLSFPGGHKFNLWKNKWKSTGMLLNSYFMTQPFLVNVAPDANGPKCETAL
jgi:hypothetical protein